MAAILALAPRAQDLVREAEIAAALDRVVRLASVGSREEARRQFGIARQLIAERSPAQILRMEFESGLAQTAHQKTG